jgi:hypothetical protein
MFVSQAYAASAPKTLLAERTLEDEVESASKKSSEIKRRK